MAFVFPALEGPEALHHVPLYQLALLCKEQNSFHGAQCSVHGLDSCTLSAHPVEVLRDIRPADHSDLACAKLRQ
jgi:hypothetical protein